MSQGWKAGVAVVDITPPVGVQMGGYVAREQGSIGVHDQLYAKALVLDDNSEQCLLVMCDLLGIDAVDVRSLKVRIEARTGIPTTNMMIAASHTHSGPATLHTNGIGRRNEAWIQSLYDKVVACAEQAAASLEEVTVKWASGIAEIGINRRGKIPAGEINPVPDPSGPVDREVSVLCVDRVRTGNPWVVVFNYGCHPTVLGPANRLVSADYPGAAMHFIERALGEGTVAMFTNGGAGNVNPIQTGSFDVVQHLGEQLGAVVVQLVRSQGLPLKTLLRGSRKSVQLPFNHIPTEMEVDELIKRYTSEAARREWRENSVDAGISQSGTADHVLRQKIAEACLEWAKSLERKRREGRMSAELTIEVHRLRIGDLFLLGVPLEVFAETVLFVKNALGNRALVVGYANGNEGYLPPQCEISKGGYEVLEAHKYYGHPAHFSGEAEESLREALVGLGE